MSLLTFCVLAGLFGILLLGTLLENYNQRVYQRDMDRRLDEAIARAQTDTTPTDWSRYLPLSHQEQRERALWRERAYWKINR